VERVSDEIFGTTESSVRYESLRCASCLMPDAGSFNQEFVDGVLVASKQHQRLSKFEVVDFTMLVVWR
jgi:hypothetical protein